MCSFGRRPLIFSITPTSSTRIQLYLPPTARATPLATRRVRLQPQQLRGSFNSRSSCCFRVRHAYPASSESPPTRRKREYREWLLLLAVGIAFQSRETQEQPPSVRE